MSLKEVTPLEIDVVSDIVCPWCLVGKRRLEKAIGLRPDIPIVLRFHPFFLNDWIPRGGITREEYLKRRYGTSGRPQNQPNLAAEAIRAEGLVYDTRKLNRVPNTLDCHRLIHWAGAKGPAMKQRLMELYFSEGGDLTNPDTLVKAATDIGLDASAVRQKLASNDDVDAMLAAVQAARDIGVNSVPFFVFGGVVAVSGAQPPEFLTQAMDEAIARRAPAE
jgi:predicted DsbA family dithiol-disulfide isomerase